MLRAPLAQPDTAQTPEAAPAPYCSVSVTGHAVCNCGVCEKQVCQKQVETVGDEELAEVLMFVFDYFV